MRTLNFYLLMATLLFSGLFTQTHAQSISYEFNHQDDFLPANNDHGTKCYYWNNGILVLGSSGSGNATDCMLTFQDTLGNIIWNKSFSIPSYDPSTALTTGKAVTFVNNSAFYVTGITGLGPAGGVHGFFAKFDSNGDTLFTRVYMDSVNNYPTDMIVISPDTFLALVVYNQGPDRINRIDSLGNIISTYLLPPTPSITGRLRRQMIQGPGGKIYVGGDYNCTSEIFVDVYDSDLVYQASWYPSFNTSWENFLQLTVFNNEIYLTSIVPPLNPTPNCLYQVSVGKLDSNGAYQFSNIIAVTGQTNTSFGTAVVNPNCLAVHVASGNSASQYLFFLDSLCNVICHTPLNVSSECYGITVTPSHKIAGTGGEEYGAWSAHWNFLTGNIENYLLTVATSGIPEFDSSAAITIFPVPNNGNMNISLEGDGYNAIHVFNTLGEEIYAQNLDEEESNAHLQLVLENAANGLYIVQVIKNTGTISKRVTVSR